MDGRLHVSVCGCVVHDFCVRWGSRNVRFCVMYACLFIPVGQPCSAANGSLLPHNRWLSGKDLLTRTQGLGGIKCSGGIDMGRWDGGLVKNGMGRAGWRVDGWGYTLRLGWNYVLHWECCGKGKALP